MKTVAQGFRITLLPAFLFAPLIANADPSSASVELSNSASDAVAASGTVVGSTALAAGAFTVLAVSVAGNVTRVVLQGAANTAAITLEFTGQVLQSGAVAVGETLQVVAYATGFAVISAGTLIAFVANGTGQALVHSSRISVN